MSAVPVILLAVYWFLGGLVLWRQSATRVGLAVSLALIVLPVSTYIGSNDWSAGDPRLFGPAVLTAVLGAGIMLVFFGLMTVLTLEANMDRLAAGLLGAVDKTLQPERADLWLMKKGSTKDQD